MQNDVSSKSITVHVECYQYVRLLQHYEASLRRWEQIELVSNTNGFFNTSANRLAVEVWYKAQEERKAAKERMTLHRQVVQSAPVYANLASQSQEIKTSAPHLVFSLGQSKLL
jgi:hypothetical protein